MCSLTIECVLLLSCFVSTWLGLVVFLLHTLTCVILVYALTYQMAVKTSWAAIRHVKFSLMECALGRRGFFGIAHGGFWFRHWV